MFDALYSLTIVNIQSHEKTEIFFNKTGVHRISGEGSSNSVGKSVIMKSLDALFLGKNLNKLGRETLVRYGHDYGIIIGQSYNGITLSLVIHLESSKCFYELEFDGKTIRKSLSDDYKTLLKMANFHYLEEDKFSLNRYVTKTTLPFTHTSGTLNYKILDSASENPQAKEAIDVITEKLVEIKDDRQTVERKIISLTEQLKTMDDSGIEELENRLLYVEKTYEDYNQLKPVKETVDKIITNSREIDRIKLNDYSEYRGQVIKLKKLNQLAQVLTNIRDSQLKLDQHTSTEPFNPVDLKVQLSSLKKMKHTLNLVKEYMQLEKQIEENNIPPVADITKVLFFMEKVKQGKGRLSTIQEDNKHLNEIKQLPIPVDIVPVTNSLREVMQIRNALQTIKETRIKIDQYPDKPLMDLSNPLGTLSKLFTLTGDTERITTMQQEITNTETILNDLDKELRKLNLEIGVCKHCGNKLKEDSHLCS